jgi:hypothetical protein
MNSMKFVFTFLLLLVSFSSYALPDCRDCARRGALSTGAFRIPNNCQPATASNPSCQFYECAAYGARDQMQCREGNNYFWDYGRKYCNRFVNETRQNLTAEGQRWMYGVLACLQRALREGCDGGRCRTCQQARNWGFRSHPGCYTARDPISGRALNYPSICFLRTVDIGYIGTTPDVRDLATWDSGNQVASVAGRCAGQTVRNPGQAAASIGRGFVEINQGIARRGLELLGF